MLKFASRAVDVFDETDFYHIFCDFSDYKLPQIDNRKVCIQCKEAIKQLSSVAERGHNDPIGKVDPSSDCMCDWGYCGAHGIECETIRCADTDSGCGFLFMSSCDKQCVP